MHNYFLTTFSETVTFEFLRWTIVRSIPRYAAGRFRASQATHLRAWGMASPRSEFLSISCYLLFPTRHDWLFPFTRFSRAENCLDYRHGSNRAFQRNGQLLTFAYALREQIAVDRVLISSLVFHHLGTPAGGIGSIVDINAARSIRRCIERNLYFDPGFGSEDLYLLIRHHLGATGEHRVPGRKMKYSGRQRIGVQLRILFNHPKDFGRFFSENESGSKNQVTPDIHHSTASVVADVANIFRILVIVAEASRNGPNFSDFAALNLLDSAPPLRMGTNHEGLLDLHSGTISDS